MELTEEKVKKETLWTIAVFKIRKAQSSHKIYYNFQMLSVFPVTKCFPIY